MIFAKIAVAIIVLAIALFVWALCRAAALADAASESVSAELPISLEEHLARRAAFEDRATETLFDSWSARRQQDRILAALREADREGTPEDARSGSRRPTLTATRLAHADVRASTFAGLEGKGRKEQVQ